MEPNLAAEELPALYRAVLDRVAQLEGSDERELARRIRADAMRIYSKSWDARAKNDLEALLRRHALAAPVAHRPGRSLRWRIFRAA
ncbi:MAG: hypothetical protein QOI37_1161 [Chloroflexota bacterium]|jgi:hypothetical protein|nr:hypothetical protein [Chloroflexota bacterium]MEA2653934.1 hypothetical protein [Chloroflexota bacterium]